MDGYRNTRPFSGVGTKLTGRTLPHLHFVPCVFALLTRLLESVRLRAVQVNGRVLKAHTSFLALHAPHWPPLTLAPEVRSLLCPPSPDSPTYFTTEPTGQGVTFRYLAALDIWSVGALAYRLLTHDAEPRDVALSEAPVASLLAHVPPRFDPPLRETLCRSLAKDPSERGTAEQLMADLMRLDKVPPTHIHHDPPSQ